MTGDAPYAWQALAADVSGPESVMRLAGACSYEADHAHQVTRLALGLFDGLSAVHQMGDRQRLWTQCGGLLHDIGWMEGQKRHHKTSQRLILATDLPPLDERERALVGCVARYHRKALPSADHEAYASLSGDDRRVVCLLGALVRLADGLDRSHQKMVDALAIDAGSREIRVACRARASASAEAYTARRKKDLLELSLGRRVQIRIIAAVD